jgi:hypothetical protein
MLGEPSSPPAHKPRRAIQPRRDLGVMQPLGGIEHDPRPLDVLERQLLRPRGPLKHTPLVLTELDLVTRRARHRHITSRAHPNSFNHIPPDTSGRLH